MNLKSKWVVENVFGSWSFLGIFVLFCYVFQVTYALMLYTFACTATVKKYKHEAVCFVRYFRDRKIFLIFHSKIFKANVVPNSRFINFTYISICF